MNSSLRRLASDHLVTQTKALVTQELQIGLEILEHLREIEARRLYLERGHSSLFSFCLKELGYSEPQAQLRIDAMRAIRDTPEIRTSIETGKLPVTAVAKVQRFLRKEKERTREVTPAPERLKLFQMASGKSVREIDQALARISSESALPQERERVLTEAHSELRLVVSEELRSKLLRLRELHSHRLRNPESYAELLELLANDALKKDESLKGKSAALRSKGSNPEPSAAPVSISVDPDQSVAPISIPVPQAPRSRYIPIPIRRLVYSRDQGRCTYVDPKSGTACGSRRFVQIDHVQPFSRGGRSDEADNLRLLCGAHNRWVWEKRTKQPDHPSLR